MKVEELQNNIGKTVTASGWVRTIRDQKKRQFIIMQDETGSFQVINEKEGNKALSDSISAINNESVVEVTGTIVENKSVKIGQLEMVLKSINVLSTASSPLPIDENSNQENRLDWRFIDLRSPKKKLIFQAQTIAEHAMRRFWMERGFIEIHSPKFMQTPSESGAELFKVDYFNGTAFLAQSPQFYKQMAMAAGFNKIFEIGPVFRANPSFTSRHDTEFTMIDVEVSWIQSHEDVMHLEEEWLHYTLKAIRNEIGDNIEQTYGVEVVVPELPFPRVTMKEAYQILANKGHEVTRAEKGDLDPEGERVLSDYIKEKYNHEFVFITDYPSSVRPFYHMRQEENPLVTRSYDLLWKGLEVTTGAQREHRYDILEKQIKEKGLSIKPLQHYLNFFKYGCPPHGGYGFGLTRMLMILLNLKNVREVTYLYRGPNRLSP